MASKHAAAEAIKVRVIFVNSHLSFRCLGVIAALFFVLFIFFCRTYFTHIQLYQIMPRLSTEKRQKDQSNNSQSQHMILVRYHNKKNCGEKFHCSFLTNMLLYPSATSSIIISKKPSITPTVPM